MSSGVRCRRQALLSMCVERERVLLLSRRRHLHQGRLAAALPAVPAYARVFPESRHQMGFCALQPAQIFLDRAVKIRNDPAGFPKLNFQHWKSKKKRRKNRKFCYVNQVNAIEIHLVRSVTQNEPCCLLFRKKKIQFSGCLFLLQNPEEKQVLEV